MTEEQSKRILAVYRPGDQDRLDPYFAEALHEAESEADLARWFVEERQFDRAVAGHLGSVAVPFALKTRILANMASGTTKRWRWLAPLTLAAAAAALAVCALLIGVSRSTGQHSGSVTEYEQEMMTFINLPPPLEMESPKIAPIKQWIAERKAPLTEIPPGIAAVEAMGCRILSFRGHPVTLICFCHGTTVAHLLIIDHSALPGLTPGKPPTLVSKGEWTTATWADKHYACMLAVHDRPAAARQYLPHA
jgi:hypothetical protein